MATEPKQKAALRSTTARVLREEQDQHAVVCVRRLGMFRIGGYHQWCDRCSCYHLISWSEWWKSLVWFGGLG